MSRSFKPPLMSGNTHLTIKMPQTRWQNWMDFWRFPLQTQTKTHRNTKDSKMINCWFGWFGFLRSPYERDCSLTLRIPNQQLLSTPAPGLNSPFPCPVAVACRRSRRSGRCRAEACLCSRSDMGAGAILRCKRFQNWKKWQWRLPQNWDFIKRKNITCSKNLYIIHPSSSKSISNKLWGFLPAEGLENKNPERPYTWGIGTGMPGPEWAGGGLPCWKLGDTVDGNHQLIW